MPSFRIRLRLNLICEREAKCFIAFKLKGQARQMDIVSPS